MASSRTVDGSDLDYALGRISTAYRADAYDEDNADGAIIRDLWQECVSDGMSGEEFRDRIARMIRANRFPTWTPADFWSVDLPKLHPRSWYLERVHADRTEADRIAVYELPDGRVGYAYRDIVDGRLPEYQPRRYSDTVEEPTPEPMTDDTATMLELQKENLILQERVQAADLARDRAERDAARSAKARRQAEEDRDECRDVATELHRIATALIAGTMTPDEGRRAMEAMTEGEGL